MAMSLVASTSSASCGLRYASFGLDVYPDYHKDYLNTERFETMPSNGDRKTVYDTRNGLDRDTALSA